MEGPKPLKVVFSDFLIIVVFWLNGLAG